MSIIHNAPHALSKDFAAEIEQQAIGQVHKTDIGQYLFVVYRGSRDEPAESAA